MLRKYINVAAHGLAAAQVHEDVREAARALGAVFVVAAAMAPEEANIRMPQRQDTEIHWRGLSRQIAGDLEPRVL